MHLLKRLRQEWLGRILRSVHPAVWGLAWLWRRLLWRTKFIAVTGSAGKTTAKDCIAAILSERGRCFKSYRNQNAKHLLPLNVLRVRPWHRYAVLEAGASSPGKLARAARMLRPHIVVIVCLKTNHIGEFRSLEAIAQEKLSLISGMVRGGAVIVNGDEPLLHPADTPGAVRRFGSAPGRDLWADEISSPWPERLRLRAHAGENSVPVLTRFVGEHWAPAVQASLLTGMELGVDLTAAAERLGTVEPFTGRMEPAETPSGAVFLRDELGGSRDSWEAAFRVLEQAQAHRRIVVAMDVDEWQAGPRQRHRWLGRQVAATCQLGIFIGEYAGYAIRAANEAGMSEDRTHGFWDIVSASAFLQSELRIGDLVLLKGRTRSHLSRIFFAQFGPVSCRKSSCPKRMMCDICWELGSSAV